jgi:hypothetical protein
MPAPAPVPQAPVPLQQAPVCLPQAPLAPAHMNNGEINDNPNLIPSQSECDGYISQNLKEKIWNRVYRLGVATISKCYKSSGQS